MTKEMLKHLPSNSCVKNIILKDHPELYDDYKLLEYKRSQRPENKDVYDKPYDKGAHTRRATRPWDSCWFSNKPNIISLTVEEAIELHPQYMKWVYKNLTSIKWSVFTIRLLEKL
jgi:hypothetical protein